MRRMTYAALNFIAKSVDRYDLLVREPGKTGDSAVRVVSIADRFNGGCCQVHRAAR